LQAIATARRLGAVVHGFDVREAAREQVESLGARFVSPGEALKAQEAANGTRSKDKRHAVLQSYQTLPRIVQDGVGQFGIGHHPRHCQRADHCADHKFSVFFRDDAKKRAKRYRYYVSYPACAAFTIRCAIYTRKSSDEGLEQEFNSLDAQREAFEAYIVSQRHAGWIALANMYDDGGLSGGSMERPALKRLLEDIEASKVQIVVVYKVDRLTRSLADFAKIVDVLDVHNAFTSLVRLSYLGPEIVRALLVGSQANALTPSRLLRLSKNLPHDWKEQRCFLGFAA
jgi:predicted site-specific integrase-resolvase